MYTYNCQHCHFLILFFIFYLFYICPSSPIWLGPKVCGLFDFFHLPEGTAELQIDFYLSIQHSFCLVVPYVVAVVLLLVNASVLPEKWKTLSDSLPKRFSLFSESRYNLLVIQTKIFFVCHNNQIFFSDSFFYFFIFVLQLPISDVRKKFLRCSCWLENWLLPVIAFGVLFQMYFRVFLQAVGLSKVVTIVGIAKEVEKVEESLIRRLVLCKRTNCTFQL